MNFKIYGLILIAILAIGSCSASLVSDRFAMPKNYNFLGEKTGI